jgi:zinc transporter ZupT
MVNSFSGGIYLGLFFFFFLPEGEEKFREFYSNSSGLLKHMPIPYFIAFASFSLIFFMEKIIFDSRPLLLISEDIITVKRKSSKFSSISIGNNWLQEIQDELENLESDEEEKIKDVFSAKGAFESYMFIRNSKLLCSDEENKTMSKHTSDKLKVNSVHIDNMSINKLLEEQCFKYEPPFDQREDLKIKSSDEAKYEHNSFLSRKTNIGYTSIFIPYLILITLFLHGIFEGIALGVQDELKEILTLTVTILIRKIGEVLAIVKTILTLGIIN